MLFALKYTKLLKLESLSESKHWFLLVSLRITILFLVADCQAQNFWVHHNWSFFHFASLFVFLFVTSTRSN